MGRHICEKVQILLLNEKWKKKQLSICLDFQKKWYCKFGLVSFTEQYSSKHARHSWFDPQHNCRVRWSHETGAEMKKIGWGIRVCLLRSCCDRPLVFFQRLLGSCAARISLGIVLVRAQQEALLRLCCLSLAHATSLPACRCINACLVIDVAAGSRYQPLPISTLSMWLWRFRHEVVFDSWVEEQSVRPALSRFYIFCKLAAQGRYFSIVLQPTSVCECVCSSRTGAHLHGNDALAAVAQAIVLICSLSVLI